MVQLTPEYVNSPKPGKSWGNIKIAGGKTYLSEWANIAHCQPGGTYECPAEDQEWKDRQNPGQVSIKTVITGYCQPVGEMPLPAPPMASTPPIPAPAGAVAPQQHITIHAEPNGARVGMMFNAIKEMNLAGLNMGDTEILEWYQRAIILSDNAGKLLDSNRN